MRSEDELLRLTVRLFNMQDEERRRIARELHDGMAQNLFAITLNLARLQQDQNISLTAEVSDAIEDCQALCEQSLQEIRTLSYLLHPPLLDQAGLFSALQWYIEGFTRRTGIYVDLVELQDIGRLPSDIETALFRVVQECLTNICRHSGSDTASIRLEKHPDGVLLRIRDQGQGMDVSVDGSSDDQIQGMGVGIPGMRQRLKQLGGRLDITSGHHGTTIVAKVPIDTGARYDNHSAG
jgi:two-component system, NarL family, sensor kinase